MREEIPGASGVEPQRLGGVEPQHLGGVEPQHLGGVGPQRLEHVPRPVAGDAMAPMVAGAAYGMLFLLGIVLGVVGGFQHSWYAGGVPVAALAWLVVLFAVPYGMGRLMGGKAGALVPALGWFASSFLLAAKQRAGDLVIAGDTSGFWYLYGGVAVLAVAVIVTRSSGSWLLRSYGGA